MKRRFRSWFIVLTALLWASSASEVRAQENIWTGIGPQGTHISALAVDPKTPTTLYAGTADSEVFKSVDGGEIGPPSAPACLSAKLILL